MASSRVTSLPRKKLTTLDFSAHACISVNSTNRDLVAFIDGKNMHHGPVDKEDKKIELRDRVLLGATWLREKQYFQSGASVGNVNVYDKILHPMTMKKITETGMFPKNPAIGWETSNWKTHGNVTIRTSEMGGGRAPETYSCFCQCFP